MNNKFDFVFVVVILTFFMLIIVIGMITFTKQNKEYLTDLSCKEIRECVILELNCVDELVNNSLLGFKWSFKQKTFLAEQREYYKLNCFDKDDA